MQTGSQVIDAEFLEVRCMLLEIAATLDRYDLAAGDGDPRLELLREALALVVDRTATPDRAERLLRLFSGSEGSAGY